MEKLNDVKLHRNLVSTVLFFKLCPLINYFWTNNPGGKFFEFSKHLQGLCLFASNQVDWLRFRVNLPGKAVPRPHSVGRFSLQTFSHTITHHPHSSRLKNRARMFVHLSQRTTRHGSLQICMRKLSFLMRKGKSVGVRFRRKYTMYVIRQYFIPGT